MKLLNKIIWCFNLIILVGCSISLYTNCSNKSSKPEMIICQKDSVKMDTLKIDSLLNVKKY